MKLSINIDTVAF